MRLIAPLALACCVAASGPAHAMSPADVASEQGLEGRVTLDRLPKPAPGLLANGAEVWAGRCNACHSYKSLTGAPKITSTKAWSPRIAQGLPTLFEHAIGGFMGPKFLEMPPRGGDPDLTDAEVKAAVAFMVWVSGGETEVNAWINEMETTK